LNKSTYYDDLKNYFDIFPEENIKTMLFDDLKKNPEQFLKEIEIFLGIKEYIPENINKKSNVTGVYHYKYMNGFMYKTRRTIRRYNSNFLIKCIRLLRLNKLYSYVITNNVKPFDIKPKLDINTKNKLTKHFTDDINKLEGLLNRDLSNWK